MCLKLEKINYNGTQNNPKTENLIIKNLIKISFRQAKIEVKIISKK